MAWKAPHVSELRSALCFAVLDGGRSVADVARDFSVSRKTADKWVQRARRERENGLPLNFADRSRKPTAIPRQTSGDVEQIVLAVRKQFGWGPRKIHGHLRTQDVTPSPELPPTSPDATAASKPTSCRSHPASNDLSQTTLAMRISKRPLEIARQKIHPFTVLMITHASSSTRPASISP